MLEDFLRKLKEKKMIEKLCGSSAIALRLTCEIGDFCRFLLATGHTTACEALSSLGVWQNRQHSPNEPKIISSRVQFIGKW